ncbi:hypothetical protein JKF63_07093 [Porcisia hertigi]|uniref:EF-hand domain-containing protein n=1 Tax=Porcisia hertigi TaxID=2761500 RepID=A0A836LKB8_9TRYP|nr:hypothetical protein JKF63_07093 [Porcisia hertigi]
MKSSMMAPSSSLELAKKSFLVDILRKAADRIGYKQVWRVASRLGNLPSPASADAVRDALRDLFVFLSDEDYAQLCETYATDTAEGQQEGSMIDTSALIQGLIEVTLSSRRKYVVELIIAKLDPNSTGVVSYQALSDHYDVMRHPDVRSGARTEDDLLLAFFDNLCAADGSPMQQLTTTEMMMYCGGVSMSIKDDSEFELWCTRAFCLDRAKMELGAELARVAGSRSHSRRSRLLGEGRQHPLYTTTNEEYGKDLTTTDHTLPKHGRTQNFTRNLIRKACGATSMNM